MCSDALEEEPECLPLLLIRARAQIALRHELDAQADLRDAIRIDPACALAFRLLGILAARRSEPGPAQVFFREAVRLDPGDRESVEWLRVLGTPRADKPRAEAPRMARGTQTPSYEVDERPTKPFARGSSATVNATVRATPTARTLPANVTPWPDDVAPRPTITGHPPTQPPAKEAPRLTPRPAARSPRASTPELPGFGEYLVSSGILTLERLRAAQAYQRSMKVQLSTAIVTLGLASPQRIEWAAVSHQSQLARQRT